MVGLGVVLTGSLLSVSTLWSTQRSVWFYIEGLRAQYAAESVLARADDGGDSGPRIVALLGCLVQLEFSHSYRIARARGRMGVERVLLRRQEGDHGGIQSGTGKKEGMGGMNAGAEGTRNTRAAETTSNSHGVHGER